jgi:toxin ParE1/3/4
VRLRYTPQARRDLESIVEFVAERSPDAARIVGQRIQDVINLLIAFPQLGHKGTLPETREMVVPGLPYVIV